MKKSDFQKQVHQHLYHENSNPNFMVSWYQKILMQLKVIKDASKHIKHARHLGDFLEDQVVSVFNEVIPKKFSLEKGFAINRHTSISKEQDILIVDTSLGSPICTTDTIGYHPIESVLASIEIKSNLNLAELRKSLLSCISIKKLNHPGFTIYPEHEKDLMYAIFAYSSSNKSTNFEKELNEMLIDIPEALRPNMIFILDKGLYLPEHGEYVYTRLDKIQCVSDKYQLIPNDMNQNADAENFILMVATIIAHLFEQSKSREPVNYSSYLFTAQRWLKFFEEKEAKSPKGVRSSLVSWDEKLGQLFTIYDEKCPVCEHEYMFYPTDILTSKKGKEALLQQYHNKGFIPLPKSKEFECQQCNHQFSLSLE
ncbi:DUF6602 domain-containing protein [Vibrio diazotrophicus]|uniref:DUF6602 domain-containing protein n=1 Tax=Vibrio diazotrophicus TaxID=685 RepID=UPI00142DD8A7|nr:DUF6602 domain-containing protein [Vibrio diazotrophicus]NIY94604.1 hypothetical protein [Vibrio diazotrophicus]